MPVIVGKPPADGIARAIYPYRQRRKQATGRRAVPRRPAPWGT